MARSSGLLREVETIPALTSHIEATPTDTGAFSAVVAVQTIGAATPSVSTTFGEFARTFLRELKGE